VGGASGVAVAESLTGREVARRRITQWRWAHRGYGGWVALTYYFFKKRSPNCDFFILPQSFHPIHSKNI
jgi:hypothetical protein